ncbi:hypothetical protein Pyrfu_1771 [Pyrolobus fumarii 1A]|uniref:Uncharacterized protein n=1 Tax=Pyrolobus fumarii (strain DSM 11204 / 1A) TaxID=694429 RepID=G0ECQ5_PYRF1|nr:hypothetical protein Pyrfu_1771 [Pyrolobus fumarii 1A]
MKDVTASSLVALLIDVTSGRVASPKSEALFAGIAFLYSTLWLGRGDPREGAEALRDAAGGPLDGAVVARATIAGLAGLPGREAWSLIRELMEGKVPRHWISQQLMEAYARYKINKMQVMKWFSDPSSIRVRSFNSEVAELAETLLRHKDMLEELARLDYRRYVEAGKTLYQVARRTVERSPRFVERIAGRVRRLMLWGL